MVKKKENPSAVRSRIALIDAVISLMKEKSIKKISIKEITDTAGLSRQTFYTNFDTKSDIIKYALEKLFEMLNDENSLDVDFFYMYFHFWDKHKILLEPLFAQSLDFIFLLQNRKYFKKQHERINKIFDIPKEDLPYIVGYLSNLTYIMLQVWIIEDKVKSIDDVYEITMGLIYGKYFKNSKI